MFVLIVVQGESSLTFPKKTGLEAAVSRPGVVIDDLGGVNWSIDTYMNTLDGVERLLRPTPKSLAIAPTEIHSTVLFHACLSYTRVGFKTKRRNHGS
jgi:uncharacterized membrane protein